MSNYDGAMAAILLVIGLIVFIAVAYSFWLVAGFICTTLGWYALSDLAQVAVFCVMGTAGAFNVGRS